MKQLQDYVDGMNRWGQLFGNAPLSLDRAADRQRIANRIDSDLSPENLTCDGELSARRVLDRHFMLTRCANQLKKLDPNVQFYEC